MDKKIGAEVFEDEISWMKGPDAEFIYVLNDKNWKIRINDFPAEPLYTLIINDHPVLDFDDWPQFWDRPK